MVIERRCERCGSLIADNEGSVMVGSDDGGKYLHLRCWNPEFVNRGMHSGDLKATVEALVIQSEQLVERVAALEAFIETVKAVTTK